MNDKNSMTLNQVFGEKNAASDSTSFGEGARRLTEDELFEFAEYLLPVGRVEKLRKAGSRGIKIITDLYKEFIGKGKKMSGEVPVAKDPFDLLPKRQDPGLTMRDILEGSQRAMDVPAFEREALGLTKRVRIPGRKQNVETGQQSINEILRLEAPTPFQVRMRKFADDLSDRVYRGKISPEQRIREASLMKDEDILKANLPGLLRRSLQGRITPRSERLSSQLERLLKELEM